MRLFCNAVEFFGILAKVFYARLPPPPFLAFLVLLLMMPATSFGTPTIETTSGVTTISHEVSSRGKTQGHSSDTSSLWLNRGHIQPAAVKRVTSPPTATTIATKRLPVSSEANEVPKIFAWGHVTKYSTILYDENIVLKGPAVLDVKYPEVENSNTYTIIGIHAYNNNGNDADAVDPNNENNTGNQDLQVYPVMGGIGFNFTVVRFLLSAEHELHYKLTIHGVDI